MRRTREKVRKLRRKGRAKRGKNEEVRRKGKGKRGKGEKEIRRKGRVNGGKSETTVRKKRKINGGNDLGKKEVQERLRRSAETIKEERNRRRGEEGIRKATKREERQR